MTDIIERINEACIGHPFARIPWPHRLLHDAREEIEHLRREVAEMHAGLQERAPDAGQSQ